MLSVVTIESATLRKEDVRMTIWGLVLPAFFGGAIVWAIMDARLRHCMELLEKFDKLTQDWLKWSEPFNPGDCVYIDMDGRAKKIEGATRVTRHD